MHTCVLTYYRWCWLNLQFLLPWNVTLPVLQLTHCDCTCWRSDALFPCCGWSCIWHVGVTAQQLMRLHKLSSINWKHLTPDWHNVFVYEWCARVAVSLDVSDCMHANTKPTLIMVNSHMHRIKTDDLNAPVWSGFNMHVWLYQCCAQNLWIYICCTVSYLCLWTCGNPSSQTACNLPWFSQLDM